MENSGKAHMPIKEWNEDDKPREKMLLHGPASLSKSELLAILINNGTKSRSAIDLARDLLELCSANLHHLARMSVADLCKIQGIGPAKAVTIKAALEIGIRKEADRLTFRKTLIRSSTDTIDFLQNLLQDEPVEKFVVIFLNKGLRVLATETFGSGGLDRLVVDVRPIARRAVELGATGVILSHNHPSGSFTPSPEDFALTEKLKNGLLTLDIRLIDHIIVSDEGFHSFERNGAL